MAANNNIEITDLDFDSIKNNLKTFMRSQDKFKDYDFEGSGLSVLMDMLAYNTHYNAYYLNMVANEMFMDTAALRSSVVSHAKLLNYTPQSTVSPQATITVQVNQVGASSYTLPQFTRFQSEAVDGVNYTFITKDAYTENTVNNTATFNNVELYQGEPISLSYTYDASTNSKQLFTIPDSNVDTATLTVRVQTSSTNTDIQIHTLATDVSNLNGSSAVYFLQESLNGQYEIYFGDGVLGKTLTDGNLILLSYVVTNGTSAAGANNFVLLDTIASGNNVVIPYVAASTGKDRESIDSIKFNAPKVYSAQGRAVTKEDYISLLQTNNLGFSFDSINVWSGADNNPPVNGQVFISAKPSGGYALTKTQKDKLVQNLIKPASVITVTPIFLNPDYTYLLINAKVLYDQSKTTLTSTQLSNKIKAAIQAFTQNTLNTFNSTFSMADLILSIQNSDRSIITNESNIKLEKKFFPILGQNKNYTLQYGVELERSVLISGIYSTPTMKYYNNGTPLTLLNDVYIEEVPFSTSGVESILLLNPGFNYTDTPTIEIVGDGNGATAEAEVINGLINKITITNAGSNYTQALVNIVNADTDTTGTSGYAIAQIQGQYGSLRSYYFDKNNNDVKTILNDNIATVDYYNGTITFNNFAPYEINNPLGQLSIIATPKSTIISSSQNRIITVDEFDSLAINVELITK